MMDGAFRRTYFYELTFRKVLIYLQYRAFISCKPLHGMAEREEESSPLLFLV